MHNESDGIAAAYETFCVMCAMWILLYFFFGFYVCGGFAFLSRKYMVGMDNRFARKRPALTKGSL